MRGTRRDVGDNIAARKEHVRIVFLLSTPELAYSGVSPFKDFTCGSAPEVRRKEMRGGVERRAARCNGVQPAVRRGIVSPSTCVVRKYDLVSPRHLSPTPLRCTTLRTPSSSFSRPALPMIAIPTTPQPSSGSLISQLIHSAAVPVRSSRKASISEEPDESA